MQKCKNCQGILLPGAVFCHKCGSKVGDETEVAEEFAPVLEVEKKGKNEQGNAKEIATEIVKEIPKEVALQNAKVTIDFEIIDNRNQPKPIIEEEKVVTKPEKKVPIFELEDIKITETKEPKKVQVFEIKEVKTEEKIEPKQATQFDTTAFKSLFFNALHARVQDEHDAKQYSEFVELFYRKKFQDTLAQRYSLLVEEFAHLEQKMPLPEKPKERLLTQTIENLIDYFIYTYCKDLHDVYPHQIILRYADAKPEQIKSLSFFNDFLHLQDENLLVYNNFISMSQEKLKNAFQSYLFTEREELVYFICDLSLTGSGKEGFAISNKRMYWRMPLGKSHSVSFDNIQNIKHEKEWLEINGLFFNVNKSLNMKVLRMFKKIKLIYK